MREAGGEGGVKEVGEGRSEGDGGRGGECKGGRAEGVREAGEGVGE